MENKDLISTLGGQIETRILPNKNYPYVPASAVRSRLNEAFGGRWDTHILSSEIVNDDNVLVLLELTCMVGDEKIVKESFGSAPIHKYNSGPNQGKPVNLGDAYNNALMDSIKAAAKQLGVGNRQLDVKKDPRTGRYVPAGPDNKTTTSITTAEQAKPETVQPKSENVQPRTEPDSNPDDVKAAKLLELRKKLETHRSSASSKPEPKPESKPEPKPEPKPESGPEPKPEEVEPDYGFDYGGVGNSDESAPKNTQKLVILNLAKMQKLTPEEYINKALGKTKTIDELTAEEAGQVVRAGLSKFE